MKKNPYKHLPPLERKPDGTPYRMTPAQRKQTKHNLQGHTLFMVPSEGLVSSELWLKCRKKILANASYQAGRKAVNTWLAGKIKCGRCQKALKAEGSYKRVFYHSTS